jgi:hypothetical protein
MATHLQPVRMVPVEEDAFVAIGYAAMKRQLYITFRDNTTMSFQNVPGFRFDGLMAAPRKEAYFKTFIQNSFLAKPAAPGEIAHT